MFCEMIKNQTEILFQNLKNCIEAANLSQTVDSIPNWRYIYHTLHSLDKWYINPTEYTEPDNFEQGTASFDKPCGNVLSKEQLNGYADKVFAKIRSYLDEMSDHKLVEKPLQCQYTRLELILGQFRHVMCHVGIIMGAALVSGDNCPEYIGLDRKYK